jgi:hypothetical protein
VYHQGLDENISDKSMELFCSHLIGNQFYITEQLYLAFMVRYRERGETPSETERKPVYLG